MTTQDARWAVSQYEGVRHLLPTGIMPQRTERMENLAGVAETVDAFLLDAFGVLNVGNTAIAGAPERVEMLRDMGKRVLVLTNGATSAVEQAQEKFAKLGFDFRLDDIVSSRDALTAALRQRREKGVWGVMAPSDARLETLGVTSTPLERDPAVYAEACGFLLLSTALWSAEQQDLLRRSLMENPRPVLVGNPDIVAPRETGLSIEPGYHGYALITELGLVPHLFGKPFGNIFDLALERLPGLEPSRIAMVGDTLHTDVLGGAAAGLRTVLVSDHGLFAGCDYSAFIDETGIVPDYVVPSI